MPKIKGYVKLGTILLTCDTKPRSKNIEVVECDLLTFVVFIPVRGSGGGTQMRTSESQYAAEALKNVPTWTCVNHRPTITGSVITAKQSFSHHISFTPPWRSYCTPTLLRPARFILHLFWAPLLRVQLKVTVMWGRKHFPSNIRFSQGNRRKNVQISHNLMFW